MVFSTGLRDQKKNCWSSFEDFAVSGWGKNKDWYSKKSLFYALSNFACKNNKLWREIS